MHFLPKRAFMLSSLSGCFGLAYLSAEEPAPSAEAIATQWARVRQETVRLQTDWRSERAVLEASVDALRHRVQTLQDRRDLLDATTAPDRDLAQRLHEQSEALRAGLDDAEVRLNALRERLLPWQPRLPPLVARALDLPYRSLANEALPLAERLRYAFVILDRCTQFNGTITLGQEAIQLPGHSEDRLVDTLYWGLSHAYALDRAAGTAFIGRPGEAAWEWEARPELAASIERLIAIHRGESEPGFVLLPARVPQPQAVKDNP